MTVPSVGLSRHLLQIALAACLQLGAASAWSEVIVISSGPHGGAPTVTREGDEGKVAEVTTTVTPTKESFAPDEAISVVVRITNGSAKKVRITHPDSRTF